MYPLAIASAWNHGWLGGDTSCIYYGLMGFLCGVASIMTLTAMAVVRLIITTSSTITANNINRRNIQISIVCIWLYALVWSIFPLSGWGEYGPEPIGTSCTIAWAEAHNSWNTSAFITVFFIICVILPASTLTLCYSWIALKHYQAYRNMKSNKRIFKTNKMQKKLTVMAVLVSVGFLGCWAPYAAISLWSVFHSSVNIPPTVSLLPCLFAKSSTVYNPFIYYAFSSTFRKEIREVKFCCIGQVQVPIGDPARNQPSVRWMKRNNVQIQPFQEENQ
ncbi:OPN5 protein, partial [Amia calva]|nr:OPN5 protein [Amia calva]